MPDREKVIDHLLIIRTWNEVGKAYAYDEMDKKEKAKTVEWIDDALKLLKDQEAKTGHWIEKEDYNLDTYYDCSVCGESWTMIDGTPWENGMNYCPHCGAKMEGR